MVYLKFFSILQEQKPEEMHMINQIVMRNIPE